MSNTFPSGLIGDVVSFNYRRRLNSQRETWHDLCVRTIDGIAKIGKFTDEEKALVFKMQAELKTLTSGRWLWVGGTEWVEKPENFAGAYNCQSSNIIDWDSFGYAMNFAMMGTGTGGVLEDKYISQLPIIRNQLNVKVVGEIEVVPVGSRLEDTTTHLNPEDNDRNRVRTTVVVGDSRKGWVDAYVYLLELSSRKQFLTPVVFDVTVDISNVRPNGEKLKSFGGTANPVKLPEMFPKIANILNKAIGRKLTSVECCLLMDEAAVVIVAGSIRRSAGMRQGDANDGAFAVAKDNLWQNIDGQWKIDPERDALRMANHTRVFHRKPTEQECLDSVRKQYHSGEGAIQWAGEAIARANADLLDTEEKKQTFLEKYARTEYEARIYLSQLGWHKPDEKELNHRMSRYGLNPCLTSDTLVFTSKGAERIQDLVGKTVTIFDGKDWIDVDNFRVTGHGQDVYNVTLASGDSIKATPYHTFILMDGTRKPLNELQVGDRLKDAFTIGLEYTSQDFTVTSIEYHDNVAEVYCCTVPTTNSFALANGVLTGNCGEILGEDFFCVDGKTMLITREGMATIESYVGQEVEVWNGERWSKVTPFKTGSNRKMLRVSFGDGSYLDTTEYHRFLVKDRFRKDYSIVQAKDLLSESNYAIHTKPFEIVYEDGVDVPFSEAYTLGVIVGDGAVVLSRKGSKKLISELVLHGEKQHLPVLGNKSAPKQYKGYTNTCVEVTGLNKLIDHSMALFLKNQADGFDILATWSKSSILAFLAGLADTDGSNTPTGGIRIYISQFERAKRVQLLLTKCGIRSSVLNVYKAGDISNYGTRKHDLYAIQITDCQQIPCKRLNVSNGHKPRMKGKNQVITSVVELPDLADSYCFTEPEFNNGVFGNTLTKNCNLSEIHLNRLAPHDHDEQEQAFRAATLSVCALLHHDLSALGDRFAYSREIDPIIGVSFTGLFDFFVNLFGRDWLDWWAAGRPSNYINLEEKLGELKALNQYGSFEYLSDWFKYVEAEYLSSWRSTVEETAKEYCERHGLRLPNRCTTTQPAGCLTAEALRVSNNGLFYVDELMDQGVGDVQFPEIEVRDGFTSNSGISNPERHDLIKITLSHGRQITATPCHRFSVNGEWVRADQITNGMVLDFEVGQYTNAIEAVLDGWYALDPKTGRRPRRCRLPEYMSPDLAYFIGAIYGNGCFCSAYRIRISHGRMDVLMRLRDIGIRLFGLFGVLNEDPRGGRFELYFANKQLFEWFKLNKIHKDAKSIDLNRIPVPIRMSSRSSILGFFAGLIDTDGCIRANGALSIDMACEPFIRNLQQIGEAVGLIFGVSHNNQGENLQKVKNVWSLSLSKCTSDLDSINRLNQLSLKAIDTPLKHSCKTNGKKHFVVTFVEHNQSGYTYDITINTDDDNEAWYWQGAIKSHNSKSLLTGASAGWHPPIAHRFIRRVTKRVNDPIALAAIALGYNVVPAQTDKDDNGNLLNDPYDPRCTEWLIEIPVSVPWADIADGIDFNFSALAQFDFYMQVQQHYTAHNTSATISLRETEIEPLANAIYESIQNDTGYISAALLARFDENETFPRLPFEAIDKATYERLSNEVEQRKTLADFNEALALFDNGKAYSPEVSACEGMKCELGGAIEEARQAAQTNTNTGFEVELI